MRTLIKSQESMPNPEFAEHAGRAALVRLKQFSDTSALRKPERRVSVQALSWEDITLGRLLDQGYFSSVYEATLTRGDPDTYYAVKCLREDITVQQETFDTAAVDLALEAQILAKLMHPNIIHLHGYMGGCISESFCEGAGFFLVLDLLVDTLDKRLSKWRRKDKGATTTSIWRGSSFRTRERRQRELDDRIEHVALGVAEGLAYVHSRGLLYRDLKPQNIGMDEHGVVRIFDFGLAREADAQGQIRHMTGAAGTPRYMSPECAKSESSCSYPSDVYSFSILFWEILTLQKPFEGITSLPQFHEEVVRRNVRPPLHRIASPQLRALLDAGWDENPERRPTFPAICDAIKSHLSHQHQRSGSTDGLTDSSEPSGHLLRRESSGNTELMRSNHGSTKRCSRFLQSRKRSTDDRARSAVDRPKRNNWFQFLKPKKHFPGESVLDLSSRSLRIRQELSSFPVENLSESASRGLSGMSQHSKCESEPSSGANQERRSSTISNESERKSSLGSGDQRRRSSAGSTKSLSDFNECQRRRSSAGSTKSLSELNEYQRRRSSAGSTNSQASNNEWRVSSMSERMAETLAAEAKSNREVLRQLKSRK